MPAKYTHVHRYTRKKLGNNGFTIFKCNLPACPHYVREELAEGRLCICNRCGKEMILDKRALQLKKPHCSDCVVSKKKATIKSLEEFLAVKEG